MLDSTVLIDAGRRREPALSWFQDALRRPDEIGVSAITIAEFFSGLRPPQRNEWQTLLEDVTHWDVTRAIAIQAGIFCYDFARRGRTIFTPDALIAATAVIGGAALVTANVRDFPMPEIEIIRLDV
ncbi:MAG TPA: type II toxin-antitoxin system VapC family toxin [Thermomicrobiales bacterium]|nr:type II toxin-antitoxin system VapC family toxin [Thermomicrobiales bacterium]